MGMCIDSAQVKGYLNHATNIIGNQLATAEARKLQTVSNRRTDHLSNVALSERALLQASGRAASWFSGFVAPEVDYLHLHDIVFVLLLLSAVSSATRSSTPACPPRPCVLVWPTDHQ